jgi:hypothetical protein
MGLKIDYLDDHRTDPAEERWRRIWAEESQREEEELRDSQDYMHMRWRAGPTEAEQEAEQEADWSFESATSGPAWQGWQPDSGQEGLEADLFTAEPGNKANFVTAEAGHLSDMLGAHAEGLTLLKPIDEAEEKKQLADLGIQADPGEVRQVPQLQSTRRRGRSGGRLTEQRSTTLAFCLLPKNISRGRRRYNQEQEKVFHEYAGGPFRVDEGGQTGGRGKTAPRPPQQFWRTGNQHQGGVVGRDGTEFDLSYRFEDSLGDGDNHEENSHRGGRHGGRRGDVRDGKGAKHEAIPKTCAKKKVLQQVDEKAANNHHFDADNGYRPGEIGDQNGVTKLGSHSKEVGKGSTSGNIEWISLAGKAQEAITRVCQEQAPGIGYCHECGWWHELPRSYSFKTLGRSRRRQHR